MAVNINASTSSGIGITSDNSGVIQFQSNGANTVAIAANGTITNPAGTVVATATGSVAGSLIRAPQVLTSGTSYTTPANCTSIYLELVGAGGGGGGSTSGSTAGGGGGGGGYANKYFTVTPSTAYSYTVGAGGTANGNGVSGGAGGNTTFTVGATTVTAGGGGGGVSGTTASGGAGGTTTNADFGINGQAGTALSGGSANILFCVGSPGSRIAGTVYSQSGGGSAAGTNFAGAAGFQGLIRIWEYT